MTTLRRAGALAWMLGWAGFLCAATWALVALGHGALSAPPLAHGLAAVRAWATSRDAPTILMALFRLVALAAAAYLSATSGLGLLARLLDARRAIDVLDPLTLPSVRSLLTGAAAALVAIGPISAPLRPAAYHLQVAAPGPGDPPVLVPLPDPATAATVPPTATTIPPTATNPPTVTTVPPALSPLPPPVPAPPTMWTVRPGDSFWHIAALILASTANRTPTDAEIVPYWRAMIAENAGRYEDPDLLFPGQLLILPRPP